MLKNQNLVGTDGANQNSVDMSLSTQKPVSKATKEPKIIVRKCQLQGGSQENKLTVNDKMLMEYRMLSVRLQRSAISGLPRIALGCACITLDQTCVFDTTPAVDLQEGVEPTHVYLELAWSKSCGSIYEEVLPFESQIAWAGRLDALYLGRRIDDINTSWTQAPTHGVDYIVFPLSAIASEQREILLTEYTEYFMAAAKRREARLAELQKHGGGSKIQKVHAKLQSMVADADQRLREQEEEAAMQRRLSEQVLKDTPLGAVIGAMCAPTPVAIGRAAVR